MRAARAAAVLVVLGGFYYWSYRVFLGSFFAYDDFWVLNHAALIELHSPADVWQFFEPSNFLLYRPVSTLLYFYLLRQAFGFDPAGYQATQLVFHVANAVLVYAIAARLLGSRALGLATALAYATAPGHALAVRWVALFTMTGTAFFYLLGLWIWLVARPAWRIAVTLGVFAIALLAGEHAITFPIVLTLLLYLLGEPGTRTRDLWPFYALGALYLGAKLYYARFVFPARTGAAGQAAVFWHAYGLSFSPLDVLGNLGRYFGYAVDVAFHVARTGSGAIAIGVLLVVAAALGTGLVLTGRWIARPLRVAVFGLDTFIVGLGPPLFLANHLYSYYVGIAAFGAALALVGFASAVRAAPLLAPALVVVLLVTVHAVWTKSAVKHDAEFVDIETLSIVSQRWLYALDRAAADGGVDEVVVPRNEVTGRMFGQAHRLLMCASYRVVTAPDVASIEPAPGRVVVSGPLTLPESAGVPAWRRLIRPCP
jgi:hypothetical protein